MTEKIRFHCAFVGFYGGNPTVFYPQVGHLGFKKHLATIVFKRMPQVFDNLFQFVGSQMWMCKILYLFWRTGFYVTFQDELSFQRDSFTSRSEFAIGKSAGATFAKGVIAFGIKDGCFFKKFNFAASFFNSCSPLDEYGLQAGFLQDKGSEKSGRAATHYNRLLSSFPVWNFQCCLFFRFSTFYFGRLHEQPDLPVDKTFFTRIQTFVHNLKGKITYLQGFGDFVAELLR